MLRVIRWSAIALIGVLGCVWGAFWWQSHTAGLPQSPLGVAGQVSVGGPFQLVDTTGKTVTDETFRGRWMLVYFGYTFCPDVCPTELQAVAASLDLLGPLASQVAPIFVTIDPQRDTQSAMADYVKLFDDRLVGLTGTPSQIAAAAKAYRVYYARSDSKNTSTYLMDHSSFLYLMGPDGKLRQLIKPGTSAPEIAATLKSMMTTS